MSELPPSLEPKSDVSIRPCTTLEDFRQCQAVQRAIWNDSDEDVLPIGSFVVARETGGHILGAFKNTDLVGFALAFAGRRSALPLLHSHLVGVLPQFQHHGIGLSLKLRQREEALMQDISLIEWTFDPLAFANAYFNVTRLGATCRRYLPNLYGVTASPLHIGLPTDRLLAEWNVNSERVLSSVAGHPPSPPSDAAEIVVSRALLTRKETRSPLAEETQTRLRRDFQARFQQAYVVTGFRIADQRGIYSLELPGLP